MSGSRPRNFSGKPNPSPITGYYSSAILKKMKKDGFTGGPYHLFHQGFKNPGNIGQSSTYQPQRTGDGWRNQVVSPWASGMVPGGGNFNQNMGYNYNSNSSGNTMNSGFSSGNRGSGSVHGRLGPINTSSGGQRQKWAKRFVNKKGNKQKKKKNEAAAATTTTTVKDKKEDGEAVKTQGKQETEGKKTEATAEKANEEDQDDVMKDDNTDPKSSEGEATDVKANKENSEEGEKGDTTTEKENQGTEADETDIPPEALECYACDKTFQTTNGFLKHLDGKNHETLAELHLTKSDLMLKLLRAQSKLESQRQIVSQKSNKGKISVCHKCECPYKGAMGSHITIRPHKLVTLFNKCSTCRRKFMNRNKLENHLVTIQHLSDQYQMQQRVEEKARQVLGEEPDFPEIESGIKLRDSVKKMLSANFRTKVWNLDQLRPYNPSLSIGINYVKRCPQFYCTICSIKVLHTAKVALAHFRSQNHYEKYLNFITGKSKQQEVEEEAKENQDKSVKEEEEADISTDLDTLKDVLEEVGDSIIDLTKTEKKVDSDNSCEAAPEGKERATSQTQPIPEVEIDEDLPMDGIEEPDIEVLEKPVIDISDDPVVEEMDLKEESDDLEVIAEPASPTVSSPRGGRRGRARGRARVARKPIAKK